MKVYSNYIILFILVCCLSCNMADVYMDMGLKYSKAGNYHLAIDYFKKASLKDPKLLRSYLAEAECYDELKLFDSAIYACQKVIQQDQKNSIANYQIATYKSEQNKYGEAIEWYNRALISKGYNPNDTINDQMIYDMNKDGILGETEARYDVNSNEIFFDRGFAYFKIGQIKNAYKDFQGCIENGFWVKNSYYMIGHCWLQAGKKNNACEAFNKAVFYGDSLSAIELIKNRCN